MSEEEKTEVEVEKKPELKPDWVWNKRMEQFLDLAGRSPVRLIYPSNPKCQKCGDIAELSQIKPHWFPYVHVDMELQCAMCGEIYLFGIPLSRDAGLCLHIWDSNPLGAMTKFDEIGSRRCKWFSHGKMLKTKIFGDWFEDMMYKETVRFQWKCPICFLVCQENYPRDFDHGDADPLTKAEKQILDERLRNLGYIE